MTHWWREQDSNPRSPVRETTLTRLPRLTATTFPFGAKGDPFARGTDGSNPAPSSGESPANRDRGRSWGEGAMMWISAVSLSFATAGEFSRR